MEDKNFDESKAICISDGNYNSYSDNSTILTIQQILNNMDENERSMLEVLYDICFDQTKVATGFVSEYNVAIIAIDGGGNYYVSFNDTCDIEDTDIPIGYINHEGTCGRIANNFEEFLGLVVFYPFWKDIIKYERMNKPCSITELEQERVADNPDYYTMQSAIAEKLHLVKKEDAVIRLMNNLKTEPRFMVYGTDSEQNAFEQM